MTLSVFNPAFAAAARRAQAARALAAERAAEQAAVDRAIVTGPSPIPTDETVADRIIRRVCRFYGVTRKELAGPSRERRIAIPRHMAIYWLRRLAGLSLEQIARKFGRDHATIFRSIDIYIANRAAKGRHLPRPRSKETTA